MNTQLDFRELGIQYVFNPAKTVLSIGLSAPFAGSVAGIMAGDAKAQVDAIWGAPTENYSDFIVYYAYRGKNSEIIYKDFKVLTIYLER